MTSVRCSGEGSSPATSGDRCRIQTFAGPGLDEAAARRAATPSPCGSRRPGRSGRTRPRSPARGRAAARRGRSPRRAGRRGAVRIRQALARTSGSPSSSRSSASISCTRRPGRTIRASTATGADRHRAQDLEGDAADLELLGVLERARSPGRSAPRAARRAGRPGPRARGSARWRGSRRRRARRRPRARRASYGVLESGVSSVGRTAGSRRGRRRSPRGAPTARPIPIWA